MRSRLLLLFGLFGTLAACGEADAPANSSAATGASETVVAAPEAWAKCSACHALAPGRNGIGPTLAGISGQPAAQEATFAYSTALRETDIVWDDATLDAFLENPRAVVPGTKMAFAGIADPAERATLIAFLKDK